MYESNRTSKLTGAFTFQFFRIEWYVLLILICLSVLGVAITDALDRFSHWYWLCMVPIFYCACLFLEWRSDCAGELTGSQIILKPFWYWLSLFVAVLITILLREIGSFDKQSTGLVLLLLFALTTFQVGIVMGWLFRLLGILLTFCLLVVAYAEHFIWLILSASIAILAIYGHLLHRAHTKLSNVTYKT